MFLKQSTAVNIALGPFVDATDGVTAETGLTISQADVRLKKNDANWAQKTEATSATHEENGWYEVPLDATDTGTLGHLVVNVSESGALPVWRSFLVLPANVYDSLVAGSDKLQVDTNEFTATCTEPAAVPAVNATAISALSWLLALARNKITQTSTTQTLRNDADDASIATAAVSDDGTTFTRNEWA